MSESKRPTFGMSDRFNSGPDVPATPPLAADHAQARIEGWIALDATGGRMADELFVSQEVALREWPTAHAVPVFTALAAASPGEGREPEAWAVVESAYLAADKRWESPSGADDHKTFLEVLREEYELRRTPPAAPAVGVTITEAMVDAAMEASDVKFRDGGFMRYDRQAIARHLTAALRGTEG